MRAKESLKGNVQRTNFRTDYIQISLVFCTDGAALTNYMSRPYPNGIWEFLFRNSHYYLSALSLDYLLKILANSKSRFQYRKWNMKLSSMNRKFYEAFYLSRFYFTEILNYEFRGTSFSPKLCFSELKTEVLLCI